MALIAAAHRAAHQKLEGGNIFADPFGGTAIWPLTGYAHLAVLNSDEGLETIDETFR